MPYLLFHVFSKGTWTLLEETCLLLVPPRGEFHDDPWICRIRHCLFLKEALPIHQPHGVKGKANQVSN